MPFYAGFDSKYYPGIVGMTWLSGNSNLKWCGYYLAPSPNRSPTGWVGQFTSLKTLWGVLPIYVGQQDPRTGREGYTPSSILTSDQGAIDGKNAANLAATDSFPQGTFVYLDWEYGGLDGDGSGDYIKAWIKAVIDDGRVMPGIYCSYKAAPQFIALIDAINPTPFVRFWCWRVKSSDEHPFAGDLTNIPAVDPSGCGFPGAAVWQCEQNADFTFPEGTPSGTWPFDFSTSSLADPGAPLATNA